MWIVESSLASKKTFKYNSAQKEDFGVQTMPHYSFRHLIIILGQTWKVVNPAFLPKLNLSPYSMKSNVSLIMNIPHKWKKVDLWVYFVFSVMQYMICFWFLWNIWNNWLVVRMSCGMCHCWQDTVPLINGRKLKWVQHWIRPHVSYVIWDYI